MQRPPFDLPIVQCRFRQQQRLHRFKITSLGLINRSGRRKSPCNPWTISSSNIQSTRQRLQTDFANDPRFHCLFSSQPDDGLTSSRRSNDNQSDDSSSSPNGRARLWNNGRHKGAHHLSDNSVFVNITTQNSREKHVSAALERIQREKDEFDEL